MEFYLSNDAEALIRHYVDFASFLLLKSKKEDIKMYLTDKDIEGRKVVEIIYYAQIDELLADKKV